MKIKGFNEQDTQFLLSEYSSRVVAFRPDFVALANDNLNAGLLLSQLLYWFTPIRKGGKMVMQMETFADNRWWLYKRYEEWYAEVCLTVDKAKKAMGVLVSLGIVETDQLMKNGKRTTFIHLNVGELRRRLSDLYDDEEIDENDATVPMSTTGGAYEHDRSSLCALSSIAESTPETTYRYTAEDGSLYSPSLDPAISANGTEGTGSNKDLTRSTKKKNPHFQKPRVAKNGAKLNGSVQPVLDKTEMTVLQGLHGFLRAENSKYDAVRGDDLGLKGSEAARVRHWFGFKDKLQLDITDPDEQHRLVHWFLAVYRARMGAGFDKKAPSLQWLLNDATTTAYVSARPAPQPKEPKFRREGDIVIIGGRIGRLVAGEMGDDGVVTRTIKFEDGERVVMTDPELDEEEKKEEAVSAASR